MTTNDTGRFCWYELMTKDVAAAITFYGHVIGWKTQLYNEYTMWVSSQGPMGGVHILPEQAEKMGAPPHWMSYVIVENIDATTAKAKELGGQVYVEPTDIPTIGRFSVIADPQGAPIALMTPEGEMKNHDRSKLGEFGWHELLTTDHKAAIKFYHEIAGWEQTGSHDMGPMGEYLLFGKNGQMVGGMFTKSADMPMPPSWLYYTKVENLESAIDRAKEKGGTLLNGPMEVPGGTRIAQLMDPQGAAFAIMDDGKLRISNNSNR